ncbi:hypothetical protein GDO86_009454 [Hymenochirus boettgeri]|uniref:E3 ubiquitin-protein ligase RNF217 n=1 Tax=Hymenochirus boettgeri TaxID=247094 RepID=A0A8T2JNU3_9PIPI|nr:hypothetical protein GDO86_009454 [Hymenochirus boettgeri]
MGDLHEDPHNAGSTGSSGEEEEDEEEEEEEDGVCESGDMSHCRDRVVGRTDANRGLEQHQEYPVRSSERERTLTSLTVPDTEPGAGSITRVGRTRKRYSVLCTVYCVESDLSGDLPPMFPADQGSLPEVFTRAILPVSVGELPLSPTGLDLELSPPILISSLGDSAHKVMMSCRVCLEDKSIKPLSCCKKPVCDECLKRYLSSQVQLGQAEIRCPITECNKHLDESTILYSLPHDDIIKYKYFLDLSRMDSSTKPCPQCKHFTTFKHKSHIPNPTKSENKFKIQCPSCHFAWCFKCHSPWHEGINCREYKKGDKLLRHWANEIEHGQRNAQKCPKCKVHIQRTEGCDHMTCSQCNTNFCYRCGERYRQLRFFGDHTSNLSIFGCKYRYLPERPHLENFSLHHFS